jgi:hypothetical protein
MAEKLESLLGPRGGPVGKTVTVKIMWCANYFDDAADEEPVRSICIDAATEAEAATKAIARMGTCTGITLVRATPLSSGALAN